MTDKLSPLLALALLLIAAWVYVTGNDTASFLWLNQQTQLLPDWLWANLTLLADTLWAVAALLIAASYRPQLFGQALLLLLLGAVVVHAGKQGFDLGRPAQVLGADVFHIIGPTLRNHSFPSGHSFTAMAAAGLLALHWRSWRILILTVGALAAFSRIAVGAHWPLDVLVGGALGLLTAWICVWWSQRQAWINSNGWRFTSLLLLTLASVALIFHDDRYPDTQLLTVVSALLALAVAMRKVWWPLWQLIRQTGRS
ncbi:hypothetical protein GCM10011297_28210 [Bacterioplanes sanyensis]|uniref:phosphatase PAP2 family protein n=1 Tax=Bacterioplanes sanyensis TaxID=1249553 RepID=UPI00167B9E40|nr:phosphatase PAP2 family protein [Bacterioplanes sanyensis]GGY53862.1 hypothetical protein GCM10011297_28210 [Bacterioplanes sanyensis]